MPYAHHNYVGVVGNQSSKTLTQSFIAPFNRMYQIDPFISVVLNFIVLNKTQNEKKKE